MSKLTNYFCTHARPGGFTGVGDSPITFDRAHFEQQCQDYYRATMFKRRDHGVYKWAAGAAHVLKQPGIVDENDIQECYDLLLEIAVIIGSHGPRFNIDDDHGAADTVRFIRTVAALKKWCIVTGNEAGLQLCHRSEQPFQPEARQAVIDSFAALSQAAQREARWLTSDSAPVWE
jgi:hypothetical protein